MIPWFTARSSTKFRSCFSAQLLFGASQNSLPCLSVTAPAPTLASANCPLSPHHSHKHLSCNSGVAGTWHAAPSSSQGWASGADVTPVGPTQAFLWDFQYSIWQGHLSFSFWNSRHSPGCLSLCLLTCEGAGEQEARPEAEAKMREGEGKTDSWGFSNPWIWLTLRSALWLPSCDLVIGVYNDHLFA